MSNIIGVWKLDEPIYCKKELSGEYFSSFISGIKVGFSFPSCPEKYNGGVDSLSKGDLIAPLKIFQEQLNWGIIHTWPEGLFSVNAIFCFFQGEENDVKKVYADFPRWKEKFADLILINSGNYVKPDKKPLALLQYGNGIYDGLELFMLEKDQPLKRVKNHRSLEPIQLDMISCDQCYDKEKMQALFANTGNLREIAISYELLIVAYRAVLRHDFRSAIIIAATALEKAILKRIKKYYVENSLTTFEQDRKQHKMLGKEFGWLNELGISIPVQNYQTEILDVRNPTAHEGKSQNYDTTMEYLNKCKILI